MMSSAHAVSLPIFFSIQRLNEVPSWDAPFRMREVIERLGLSHDIEEVLVIEDSGTKVELEHLTERGQAVLEELRARSTFLPCPEGECEYDAASACRWCGALRK